MLEFIFRNLFSHMDNYTLQFQELHKVRNWKLLIIDDEGQHTNTTSNIVYKEVFQNLN